MYAYEAYREWGGGGGESMRDLGKSIDHLLIVVFGVDEWRLGCACY